MGNVKVIDLAFISCRNYNDVSDTTHQDVGMRRAVSQMCD